MGGPPERSQTESLSLRFCSERAKMELLDGVAVNLDLKLDFLELE